MLKLEFNPEEVRIRILQGEIPNNWHVMRSSRRLMFHRMAMYFYVPLIAITLEIFISAGINAICSLGAPDFSAFGISEGSQLILMLTMAITMSFVIFKISRNAVVIVMPEGFLAFSDLHSAQSMHKYFLYNAITDIQLSTTSFYGMYLTIQFHDGSTVQWRPSVCIGSHGKIFQDILSNYIKYRYYH